MNVYSVLQIGEYHLNNCEDYLFYEPIGTDKLLCAVMDGCTMGKDSYFIATLIGKLLRKIVKAKNYEEFYHLPFLELSLEEQLKIILKELFESLKNIKNELLLEKNEMLSTLIILIANLKDEQGVILVIGDGVICINGTITEFDQDNKPDYVGYHLSENFEEWYDKQQQKIKFSGINDISLATDGIMSFKSIGQKADLGDIDPVQYMLNDTSKIEHDEMLNMKLKFLEHNIGIKPTDDLAIIRIIKT